MHFRTFFTSVFLLATSIAATSIQHRGTDNSGTTKIYGDYNYNITWDGSYLEYKFPVDSDLVLKSWPAQGYAGELITVNDTCIIVQWSSDNTAMPKMTVDECDGSLFQPAFGRDGNQIMLVDAPMSVCKRKNPDDHYYAYRWELCELEEGGPVCIGNSEGYVHVRACEEGYPASLYNPTYEGDSYYQVHKVGNISISHSIEQSSVNASVQYHSHACASVQGAGDSHGDFDIIALHAAATCVGDSNTTSCQRFENVSECKAFHFSADEEDMNELHIIANETIYYPENGSACMLVQDVESQYTDSFVAAVYSGEARLTSCKSHNGRCDLFETAESCEAVLLALSSESEMHPCTPTDMSNKLSWCYASKIYLQYSRR